MRSIAVGSALATALLAGCGSGSSPGQARPDETQTVAPEGTTASTSPPPATAAAGVAPKGALASKFLVGNHAPRFPTGKAGELSVVAQGTKLSAGDALPVVIRNNTADTIVRPTAAASIRDKSGALVASGEDQGFHPNVVKPGEITIGYVYFEHGKLIPGSKIEFQLGGTPQDQADYENIRDVVISEFNFASDHFVGKLRNPYDETVTGPTDVEVTCFDANGTPLAQFSDFAHPDDMPAGGSSSFSINLYDAPSCPIYILGASGFSNT